MCDGRETLAVREICSFSFGGLELRPELKFQLNTFYLLKAESAPSLNVF